MEMNHVFDLINYIFLAAIMILLVGTWSFLSTIANHVNEITRAAGNLSAQETLAHQHNEILGNITATNNILNPKHH